MKTKYINPLLYSIVTNSLLYSKRNYKLNLKKRYLNLLLFLKKHNFFFFFKKKNKKLLIYLKFFENISIIKNIKIYKNFKRKKIYNLKKILQIKKNNNFMFYIFYNKLGFLSIEEVLKKRVGAFLIAKIF